MADPAANGQSRNPKEEVKELLDEAREHLQEARSHGEKAEKHIKRALSKSSKKSPKANA